MEVTTSGGIVNRHLANINQKLLIYTFASLLVLCSCAGGGENGLTQNPNDPSLSIAKHEGVNAHDKFGANIASVVAEGYRRGFGTAVRVFGEIEIISTRTFEPNDLE